MQIGPGSRIADRYTVVRPLARGGVGSLWLVRHDALRIEYALKVLNVSDPRLAERLLNEARVQATLQHSNVVRAVDIVEINGDMGVVLEYVAGPSLRALLAARLLAPLEVHLLFRGIAAGVAVAHSKGLVHRDLKPANVLLQVEPELVAKVTDFGLAKIFAETDRHATRTGAALGTPAYMAPEQVRDASRVDARADIFSLGALAYEMLTGVRAFEGEDTADTLTRVKEARYIPIRTRMPDAPPRMVAAIEAALVADPAERIPSVEEMLERWGDDVVPAAIVVGLKRDLLEIGKKRPVEPLLADRTWSDTRSAETQTSWNEPPTKPSAPPPRRSPRLPLPVAGLGLFLLGAGSAWLWHLSWPSADEPAPIALAQAARAPGPSSLIDDQKAVQQLNFFLTDLGTEAIRGQKDLTWLTETLPARLVEVDRMVADIEARWPGSEVVLQARYQAAMVHFLGYSYRSWPQPPLEASESERERWEVAIRDQIRPGAAEALQEARRRFVALSEASHPAAADSIWPRMGRQMIAQIDNIPPR